MAGHKFQPMACLMFQNQKSLTQSVSQSVSKSVRLSVHPSVCPSVIQSLSQAVSIHSLTHSLSHSVSHSVTRSPIELFWTAKNTSIFFSHPENVQNKKQIRSFHCSQKRFLGENSHFSKALKGISSFVGTFIFPK